MKMTDVGAKERTERVAVATGRLRMAPATLKRVRGGLVDKGDIFAAAQLSAVMAAKRTPDLIPLCHPVALSGVLTQLQIRPRALEIRVEVRAVDRTGVEMEALTACCAAALTVYDMLKAYDRGMVLEEVALEEKRGGRSGAWKRPTARKV